MNKKEFIDKLKAKGLEHFYYYDGGKRYVDGEKVYFDGKFHRTFNSYGVYKLEDGTYVAFISDCEKGLPITREYTNSESEAFDALYNIIMLHSETSFRK